MLKKQFPGRTENPLEGKQLQFGSLNFLNGGSIGGLTGESSNQLNSPKAPDSVPPSNRQKCNGVSSVSIVADDLFGVSGTIKENGSIANFPSGTSNNVGGEVAKEDNAGFATLYDKEGPVNQFTSLTLDDSGSRKLENIEKTGSFNDSSSKLSSEDSKKASNMPVVCRKDLLPRGLINSGNLCFLNSTMQALLSCSPFVQLLQELRTRNVPKVVLLFKQAAFVPTWF